MRKNLLKVLVVAICLVGCGGIKENITPAATANVKNVTVEDQKEIMGVGKVAIFPFADYSHQQGYIKDDIWGGNIRILEIPERHIIFGEVFKKIICKDL